MIVQVSLVNDKVLVTMNSRAALLLIQSIAAQLGNKDPNVGRAEFRTEKLCDDDVPTGSLFTVCVLDNVKELYQAADAT